MTRYFLTPEQFQTIYHKVPRAAVDVVVRTDGGFILTKRTISPFLGMWHIPGGTVFFKESLANAITRIAQDELGVSVKLVKHLGIIEYFDDDGRHTISNVFLTDLESGELRGSDQGEEVRIFDSIPDNCIPEQTTFLISHQAEIKSR